MQNNYNPAIKLAGEYLKYIAKSELTESEKKQVVNESVKGFAENVNPGFLQYRKSVSTDYTATEWIDSGSTFTDIHGKVFIDCLGGYGVYNVGHRNSKVIDAVKNQMKRQV